MGKNEVSNEDKLFDGIVHKVFDEMPKKCSNQEAVDSEIQDLVHFDLCNDIHEKDINVKCINVGNDLCDYLRNDTPRDDQWEDTSNEDIKVEVVVGNPKDSEKQVVKHQVNDLKGLDTMMGSYTVMGHSWSWEKGKGNEQENKQKISKGAIPVARCLTKHKDFHWLYKLMFKYKKGVRRWLVKWKRKNNIKYFKQLHFNKTFVHVLLLHKSENFLLSELDGKISNSKVLESTFGETKLRVQFDEEESLDPTGYLTNSSNIRNNTTVDPLMSIEFGSTQVAQTEVIDGLDKVEIEDYKKGDTESVMPAAFSATRYISCFELTHDANEKLEAVLDDVIINEGRFIDIGQGIRIKYKGS
ncbi:hypothetical protein HanRHA438_Chr11g0496921 [Helianthus annuus]|nr:hypothetical protein HanRHA438_Chr11g0496921 [Helianthus annuus]